MRVLFLTIFLWIFSLTEADASDCKKFEESFKKKASEALQQLAKVSINFEGFKDLPDSCKKYEYVDDGGARCALACIFYQKKVSPESVTIKMIHTNWRALDGKKTDHIEIHQLSFDAGGV